MAATSASPRVVSLLASGTEFVCALGFGDALVGRSHECDFPAVIAGLPALTAPKWPFDGTSYEIDQKVRAVLQEGLSIYRVDGEALRALRPDVIITQSQCEVCAVSLGDLERAAGGWIGGDVRVVNLAPFTLDDAWGDARRIAAALGAPERGVALVAALRARLAALAARAGGAERKPRVAFVEWIDPIFMGGNWMPELIRSAGGEPLFGTPGVHSGVIDWEALRAADPDVIVVSPCGFGLERIRAEFPALAARPGWRELAAVRAGRVYLADGNAYFNRSGPRLVESAEMLAEMLHPGRFNFGHEGVGWERAAP